MLYCVPQCAGSVSAGLPGRYDEERRAEWTQEIMLYFCKQINKQPESCYSALRETGHLNLDEKRKCVLHK